MAAVSYERRKKTQIYLLAALILICIFTLSACNQNDGIYDASETISEPTHFMAKFMLILHKDIPNFGWTVVVFTIVLRLCLMPLDIWQKVVARKNNLAMQRMKPQMDVIQEKYKDDQERIQQEQAALYKKEHFSMMGSCLPTIITMIIFFVVFAGFRQMVGYQFAKDYTNCRDTFYAAYNSEVYGEKDNISPDKYPIATLPEDSDEVKAQKAQKHKDAVEKAQLAVKDYYFANTEIREFLWIKNIFVPDNWKPGVPDFNTVTGQSGFATSRLLGVEKSEYNTVMGKVMGSSESGWAKDGGWNGWLFLPIFSVLLSFVSSKLMTMAQGIGTSKKDKKEKKDAAPDQMQGSMKVMQIIMPIMIGVFALMYSGAFALYMFVSSLSSIIFQLVCTLIEKIVDTQRAKKAA